MIKLTSTKRDVHWVNILVYGESGVGKTTLCATAPNPVIISAEQGLLSLAGLDIPVYEVGGMSDVREAYAAVKDSDFQTVCIDSLSELGETLLSEFKREEKDPRKAYGRMGDEMALIVRKFRDLPNKHTLFIAKQQKTVDEITSKVSYSPSMPGKAFTCNMPYFFDIVTCMRIGKKEKAEYRYLQTQPSIQYEAKDRSGKLAMEEVPDITQIINKIVGTQK
jgi:energy-coupling factor transporter ATP-binding protein EcfA2